MTEIDEIALYKKAIKEWGTEFRVIMLGEEMGELFHSISKKLRNPEASTDSIANEIADVQIMIGQMKVLFEIKEETIGFFTEQKLNRLKKMLGEK